MSRNPWTLLGVRVLVVAGVLAATRPATADDPTKQECIAANESAQALRRASKLREARARLAVCIEASCPGPVREDCAQLLADVDKATPTLVLEAKDGAGNDVSSVRVTLDGQPLTDQLAGTPIPVDPGRHRFVFEAEGLPTTAKTLVLREGDKARHERVVLGAPATTETPASEPSQSARDGSSLRAVGLVVGGVGVVGIAGGTIFGLIASAKWGSSQSECQSSKNCVNHAAAVSDANSASSAATIATIAFVAGGLALTTGAVLFFTAPSGASRARSEDIGIRISPSVGPSAAGIAMTGEF